MNLIEIAEDLKNVPDQYLMQEVQQPTGNYPAYLVVSELSRRKRMREIDFQLKRLSKKMKDAKVVDARQQPDKDRVYFGATITIVVE